MRRYENNLRWLPSPRWLPFRLEIVNPPFRLTWAQFGSLMLSHPFFDQSLAYLRSVAGNPDDRVTDFRTLIETGRRRQATNPAGIICHITRCGSTLVSNCLRAAERTTVISEALLVQQILDRCFMPSDSVTSEGIRLQALDSFVRIVSGYPDGATHRVVLKLNAFGLLDLSRLRSLWPEVPVVIVIRNPADVIASNLANRAPWLTSKFIIRDGRSVFDWAPHCPQEMDDEEYCARAVGALCSAGLRAFDEKCTVIDYSSITVDRLQGIAAQFGLWVPAESINRTLGLYSKDYRGKQNFTSAMDSRTLLRDSARGAAEKWADGPYEQLRLRS